MTTHKDLVRREIVNGVILGFVLPLAVLLTIHEIVLLIRDYWFEGKEVFSFRFQLIVSVLTNLIPAHMLYKRNRFHALRGIVGITILESLAIAVYIIFSIGL